MYFCLLTQTTHKWQWFYHSQNIWKALNSIFEKEGQPSKLNADPYRWENFWTTAGTSLKDRSCAFYDLPGGTLLEVLFLFILQAWWNWKDASSVTCLCPPQGPWNRKNVSFPRLFSCTALTSVYSLKGYVVKGSWFWNRAWANQMLWKCVKV